MKNDNHVWDNKLPTAQMLGRWQPWHAGHQKLFEEILKKIKDALDVKEVQYGLSWLEAVTFEIFSTIDEIFKILPKNAFYYLCKHSIKRTSNLSIGLYVIVKGY